MVQGIRSIAAMAVMLISLGVQAQQSALLEAGNAIDDEEKRLACLKELTNLNATRANDATSIKRVKAGFSAIAGAVNSGLSYENYKSMILEPARELGIFRQENPNTKTAALALLEKSVAAYNDAERLWRAYIYKSQDGGILFGRILNYQLLGLTDIINTYNLPTTVVLFNPHVQISTALPIIWQYAENSAKEAFDIIEGKEKIKSIPETYNGPVAQIAQVRDSTPEEILVENLAREMQCNTHPVAAKTAAKDDYTEYSVYCSKGHSQLFHCNNGSCKPLKK